MKSQIFAAKLTLGSAFLLLAGAVLLSGPALAEEAPGHELFMENKCNMCHSVESLGIERTSKSEKMMAMDLSSVGDELELDWVVKFLKKEVELEGELHKKTFKGSDDDATKIAEWLMTLKSAG